MVIAPVFSWGMAVEDNDNFDHQITVVQDLVADHSDDEINKLLWEQIMATDLAYSPSLKEAYISYLKQVSKYVVEDETYEAEVNFEIGKRLQQLGFYHEAYAFLHKTSLLIGKQPERYVFGCEYYDVIGHSYYFFLRYDEALSLLKKGVQCAEVRSDTRISMNNTIGLIYAHQSDLKQAEYYYKQAITMAENNNDESWYGVASGNLGALYFRKGNYKLARENLRIDFNISIKNKQWSSGMNALSLLARIDLAENKNDIAEQKLILLDSLLHKHWITDVFVNYYRAKTAFYENKGDYEKAFSNYKLVETFRDSVEQARDISQIQKVEFQLEFERKQAQIQILEQRQQLNDLRFKYLVLGLILTVMAAVILFWQINRRRKRQKEILELKNQIIEEDLARSEKDLRQALGNLIDKNELIAQLNKKIERWQVQSDPNAKQLLLEEIESVSLLTNEDWSKFKRLFDQRFKGFLQYFEMQYPDLTQAEIRLAVLIKLDLDKLEISKALGISPDSVRKTNLRLRKKLGIENQKELTTFIHSI